MGPLGWPGAPLAAAYRVAVAARNAAFDWGLRRIHRLPVPVVSVGNLTAGGTGKTPTVEWVAGRLAAAGARPAVLLRGYGAPAAPGVADETMLLRENLPGIPVIADPDRVKGGADAIRDGATACVLDDGFQHRRLARDLDLLCVDASDPFGGGHCLPWGLLREPVANARRAHAALVTRVDQVGEDEVAALVERLRRLLPEDAPVLRTLHGPLAVLDETGAAAEPATLTQRRVWVTAGVGNPGAVRTTVASVGALVVGATAFPDHHAWLPSDVARVAEQARLGGAACVVTTQKDWVKLRALGATPLPFLALRVGLVFHDDPAPLEARLVALTGATSPRPR